MLTPLDIENREFKRTMGGYNRDDVEDFMGLILNDYEKLYTENAQLRAQIKNNEKRLDEIIEKSEQQKKEAQENGYNADSAEFSKRTDEIVLGAGEKANEIISAAQKQADKIVSDAKKERENIINNANEEIDRLNNCYLEMRGKIAQKRDVIKKYLSSSIDDIVDEMVEGKFDSTVENTKDALHQGAGLLLFQGRYSET